MDKKKINILFTGLAKDDSALYNLANFEKCNFTNFPTIQIVGVSLTGEEQKKISAAENYDYIIFTSANAVYYFLENYKNDFSNLSYRTKIVAIGKRTALQLLSNGIDVDLIPSNSSSLKLGELLTKKIVNKKSIFIPCSDLAKVDLSNSLKSKGAYVDSVVVYKNVIPRYLTKTNIAKIDTTNMDLLIFTSPSTFHNFLQIFRIDNEKDFFKTKTIAAVGKVTKNEIEKKCLKVDIIPSEYNLNSLTAEIKNYYKLN